jgi:hypothetical protein
MLRRIILVILAALYKLIAKLHPLLKPDINLSQNAKTPSNSPKSREISDARKIWRKRWVKANPDKVRALTVRFLSRHPNYMHEYYLANIDRIKEYKKIYGIFNRAKLNERQRKWREANPDKARAIIVRFLSKHQNYGHEYYLMNKEQRNKYNREYNKEYRVKNRDRINVYKREWRRKRREAQIAKENGEGKCLSI